MEYVIYKVVNGVNNYIAKVSLPLVFTTDIDAAHGFSNSQDAQDAIDYFKSQGIQTNGFHLGQKPPH